jgi:hypothetical protein
VTLNSQKLKNCGEAFFRQSRTNYGKDSLVQWVGYYYVGSTGLILEILTSILAYPSCNFSSFFFFKMSHSTELLLGPLHHVPAPNELDSRVIEFIHPGYPSVPLSASILFKLPRVDSAGSEAVTGVHHGMALTACQIIANNSFEGYLATDKDGEERVDLPLDGLLTREFYFFFVDNGPSMSPLVEKHFPQLPSRHLHIMICIADIIHSDHRLLRSISNRTQLQRLDISYRPHPQGLA